MQVFAIYQVCTNMHVSKEVPNGATYDQIHQSITRDDLVRAEVQEIEWGHIKDSWRWSKPDIYRADENEIISWNEPVEEEE
jgi:hypothetical protein